MNELENFAELCRQYRMNSLSGRGHYSIEIKQKAVDLSKSHQVEEIAFIMDVSESSIQRWDKEISNKPSGFTQVYASPSFGDQANSRSGNASFDVILNGNVLRFSSEPNPRWFAKLLSEMRSC